MQLAPIVLVASGAWVCFGCAAQPVQVRDATAPAPQRPAPQHLEAAPAAGDPPSASGGPSSERPFRTAGWVVLSIGAEATVLAVITSIMMLHDKSVRDDNCDANRLCSSAGLQANVDIGNLAWWNASAWAVAGVGLAVGAVLVATNPPASVQRTAVAIAPTGSGVGLSVRSSF
jgi:hypothetical protein